MAALLARQMLIDIMEVVQTSSHICHGSNVSLLTLPAVQEALRDSADVIQEWAGLHFCCYLDALGGASAEVQDAAMKSPTHTFLLRLLYGTKTLVTRTSLHGAWSADGLADLVSVFLSCDPFLAHTILYPVLLSVDSSSLEVDLSLSHTLRRESMVMSPSRSANSMFLLNSGCELVLYRPFGSGRSQTGPAKEDGSTPRSLLSFLGRTSTDGSAVTAASEAAPSAMLMESNQWLPNHIHNSLLNTGSSVPRVLLSEAGTFSSVHLNAHLIEDIEDSEQSNGNSRESEGDLSGHGWSGVVIARQSFRKFVEVVRSKAFGK